MENIKITGTVVEIIYQNPDNGYTVCEIKNEEEGMFTATGYMPYLSMGESIELDGIWSEHPDYGEQFRADSYTTILPTDETAILRYLSSGIIPGIGEATAKNLVAHFGAETLNIMRTEPARLTEIKGISPKRAEKISTAFIELQAMQGVVIFLQQFGISATYAMRIQKVLGQNAVSLIKENPYILTDFPDGVGFKTADKIAFAQGFANNNPLRIKYGIKYLLTNAAYKSGHTYLPEEELILAAISAFNITEEEAQNGITDLSLSHSLYFEEYGGKRKCILSVFYSAEHYVARRISSMSISAPKKAASCDEVESIIHALEKENSITFAPEQKQAVLAAAESSCIVITGGPGTGKTTIIRAILRMLDGLGQKYVLAAPTGRAAKRMSEVCGCEAKTLHRLLGIRPAEDGSGVFSSNDSETLDADAVIVDEASMLDIILAQALLQAIKPGARLILCGDADQLPSVGPGNVLHDIIDSKAVCTISLSNIFRQAKESLIVVNAHRINHGQSPVLGETGKDFFFLSRQSPELVAQTITELYKTRLPRSYNINPINSIQILSPSKKGPAGVAALNREIQYATNPPDMLKPEYKRGNTIFRVGDKVMQIKNDYDIAWVRDNGEVGCGIFNGDMGIIKSLSLKDKSVNIIFDDDKEVDYAFSDLDRIELAYAVTVHKSQGSEFPIVIIPACAFAPMLMYRSLLYTAVTRAKDMVIIVGSRAQIERMTANNAQHKRYTGLCDKLKNIKELTCGKDDTL